MISVTDLFLPNEEIIRGKSNFKCASESGFDSYLAKSTLMSWWGSWELYKQRVLGKFTAFLTTGMYALFVIIFFGTKYNDVIISRNKREEKDHECIESMAFLIYTQSEQCTIKISKGSKTDEV